MIVINPQNYKIWELLLYSYALESLDYNSSVQNWKNQYHKTGYLVENDLANKIKNLFFLWQNGKNQHLVHDSFQGGVTES